jgi:uncharacterized membrane protein YcaP (DUF421 family)
MELVLRTTALYFFLWAITRGLGKRELAEMSAFELLLLVTVGDLIQQGVTQEDMSVTGAMLAVGTIGMWILIFSWIGYRWRPARRVVEGIPVVVVRDGRPIEAAMRLERVTLDEVLEGARNQGIGNLRDVNLGIIEPDGRFSFIKQEERGGDDDQHAAQERHKG